MFPTPGVSETLEPVIMNRSLPAAWPEAPPLLLPPAKAALFWNTALPEMFSVPPLRTKIAPP